MKTRLEKLFASRRFTRVMLCLCLTLGVFDAVRFSDGHVIHLVLAFAMACCVLFYWNRLKVLRGKR